MSTTLISIHGRGAKPGMQAFKALWLEALSYGMSKFQDGKLESLEQCPHELVYYGDLTTPRLIAGGEKFDETLDLEDRRQALTALKGYKRKELYSRGVYERLPGSSALGELIADIGLPIARKIGLAQTLFKKYAPDIRWYLTDDGGLRTAAMMRLVAALREPMARGDQVILIAHCLGSVVAYDTLWQLAHGNVPAWYNGQKVGLMLTLGSPLGDETVKANLLSAAEAAAARYPSNIIKWLNITAEDDYISHDNTVANDFKAMTQTKLISSIIDDSILNLTVRYGSSNPHSSVGYLTHPTVIKAIADALPSAPA